MAPSKTSDKELLQELQANLHDHILKHGDNILTIEAASFSLGSDDFKVTKSVNTVNTNLVTYNFQDTLRPKGNDFVISVTHNKFTKKTSDPLITRTGRGKFGITRTESYGYVATKHGKKELKSFEKSKTTQDVVQRAISKYSCNSSNFI